MMMTYAEKSGRRMARSAVMGILIIRQLIWEILELRQEKADLLGLTTLRTLRLERRMAAMVQAALKFTEDLHD